MWSFPAATCIPLSRCSTVALPRRRLPRRVGEYAQSVLGRERVFQYWAEQRHTRGRAVPPQLCGGDALRRAARYGPKGVGRQPIDLSMGHANVIWQGDANAYALRALALAADPPLILNITGPETVSIRSLALALRCPVGRRAGLGGPGTTRGAAEQRSARPCPAGLSARAARADTSVGGRLGAPGETTLNKPTKFQVRDGRF